MVPDIQIKVCEIEVYNIFEYWPYNFAPEVSFSNIFLMSHTYDVINPGFKRTAQNQQNLVLGRLFYT